MKRHIISVGCGLVLFGCGTVGPDYQAPTVDLTTQFSAHPATQTLNGATMAWWAQLNDPLLSAFIQQGAAQNLDVKAALERITAANASLGGVGVNAQTDGGLAASVQRARNDSSIQTTKNLQFNSQYVIDLFGGFARGREQALANYDAAQLDVGTARLAYLSDLTNSYLQARYFQAAAAITRQTVASRRKTLSLVQQRRDMNEATELELQQARSLLAAAEAPLPVLVANFESNVYHIATLLAAPADPILARMQAGSGQPRPNGAMTIGTPADLLRNRPDVRFAERNLAAATAAVGVAESQLYPSLSLQGTVGTGSTDYWQFGPSLSLPVFNRGFLRSRKMVALSRAREAEIGWRKSVLVAVEDVQSASSLYQSWNRQLQFLERAANASQTVLDLSQQSYREAAITLTDVLDAERQNASNQLAVADAARNYAITWMRLQVATGKGWAAESLVSPAETQAADLTADPLGVRNAVIAANAQP